MKSLEMLSGRESMNQFKNRFIIFRMDINSLISDSNTCIIYDDFSKKEIISEGFRECIETFIIDLKNFKTYDKNDQPLLDAVINEIYQIKYEKEFFIRDFNNTSKSDCEIFLDSTLKEMNDIIINFENQKAIIIRNDRNNFLESLIKSCSGLFRK